MKTIIAPIILFSNSGFCLAQTQSETNQFARSHYTKSDIELDKVYQQIREKYKTDTVFLENLKASQNLWIRFRDAEVRMKYPEREPGYYGSAHPMCVSAYLEKLIETRTSVLREWLTGAKEGDVCNGSVK